jgi:cobalt/nickel transport system permease protein
VTPALPPLEAAPRHPALGQLDARARVVMALAAVAAIVAVRRLDVAVLLLGLALVGALLAGVAAAEIRHRLAHMEGFVVLLLLLVPLTAPGPALFALGPVAVSGPGLARAALIAVKLNAAALVVLTLIGGLAPVRLGRALAGLGLPERLVRVLLFAVRYVGLLRDEAERLMTALKARGFRPTTSRHTLATLGLVLGLTLVRALERAERVGEAMRCRGFSGRFAATVLPPLAIRDRATMAAAAGLALLAVVGDRAW